MKKQSKNYNIMCIIALLQGLVFYGPITMIYKENHGITITEILLLESILIVVMLIFGIITAVAQLLCMLSAKTYAITKKLGQIKTILLFVLAIIFSVIILTITHSAILSIIFSVIIQISLSMLMPILMDVQNKSIKETSQNRATILSIYSMLGCVIGMIINLLIGLGSDNLVKISFEICLIILVIAFLFIIFYI